ncbi:nuclear transport factor 2 family protein [Stackebrandtia soli]|uniref:nuclear transport factor 2 family protein n=1 Tax=Stackebrandtia soli TaxID=1892856 RepID=UPI0039EAB8BB
MDTRTAARRWASTWRSAWPRQDVEALAALQAPDGDHYASLFRRYRGRDGLRDYLRESFAEETAPTRCWFAEPIVDGRRASIEYWAVMTTVDGVLTLSGCTVVEFDAAGLVAEARDYSHATEGEVPRPEF